MKAVGSTDAHAVTATDHRIVTEQGTLFARRWVPRDAAPRGAGTDPSLPRLARVCRSSGATSRTSSRSRHADRWSRTIGWASGARTTHPGPLPLTFISDEAAAVVPRLCDALGIDVIVPFGHSVGGGMAIATAARWPERCAAVVTESAQSFVEDRTRAGLRGRSHRVRATGTARAPCPVPRREGALGPLTPGSRRGFPRSLPIGGSTTTCEACAVPRSPSTATRTSTARRNIPGGSRA